MQDLETKGIWIDIHIGDNENKPEFTKRQILIYPKRCGYRSLQEYFLKYKLDIAHRILLKLTEAIKEFDFEKYREFELK